MAKKSKKSASRSEERRHKLQEQAVISVLIDESSSMAPVWDATIMGFNEYVSTVRKELADTPCHFSAIKFDTRGVRKLQVGAPIKQAITLSRENYQPHGGTPLLDAVARTIQATDEVAGKNKATKIVVVIQTDGEENASTDFSLEQVKTMIEERQGKGWQFLFIGAGLNAFHAGSQMGISSVNTMSYTKDVAGTRATFRASASNSGGFASGNLADVAYSFGQSAASGESADITRAKFAHAAMKGDKTAQDAMAQQAVALKKAKIAAADLNVALKDLNLTKAS